jgi:hypothetical protein
VAEAEAASTWRHVRYLLQISFKESETEQIFTIVISNQFKTGFRMRLTSSVKELEAILQKLINLDKIQNENETNDGLLAMRMPSDLGSSGLGSVQQRKRIFVLSRLDK